MNESQTNIGNKLRTLRKERKMAQVDLAAAVGISRSYIASIEKGHDAPGRETLVALASFFEVSLDWLAAPGGSLEASSATAHSKEEALLLYSFRQLPSAEAAAYLNLLMVRAKKVEDA